MVLSAQALACAHTLWWVRKSDLSTAVVVDDRDSRAYPIEGVSRKKREEITPADLQYWDAPENRFKDDMTEHRSGAERRQAVQ